MKTIVISTITLLVLMCLNIYAQPADGKKGICDDIMRCSYIFEGKVISMHDYKVKGDENPRKSYYSYLVEVTKVVKGNIQKGTINIIIPNVYGSEGSHITAANEGLYFCDDSPVKDSSVTNTNSKSLGYAFGATMANGELIKNNHDDLIGYFPTIKDFYDYISENYKGVTIK